MSSLKVRYPRKLHPSVSFITHMSRHVILSWLTATYKSSFININDLMAVPMLFTCGVLKIARPDSKFFWILDDCIGRTR